MPTTMEVGKKLVDLCNAGDFMKAIKDLYADHVVSIEAAAPPGKSREVNGKEAVIGKSEWWAANHDVHSAKVQGPWPHDDRFIAVFEMDITPKVGPMAGKRFVLAEGALYTVKDGKVVHEEFFYSMGG